MSNRRFGLTGRARGRNQERMPTIIESEPMVTGATHGPTVVNNNNTIMNIVTSDTASIINNNSTTNIFNARASKESVCTSSLGQFVELLTSRAGLHPEHHRCRYAA